MMDPRRVQHISHLLRWWQAGRPRYQPVTWTRLMLTGSMPDNPFAPTVTIHNGADGGRGVSVRHALVRLA